MAKCPYCGNPCDPVTGEVIYPHREDLYAQEYFLCEPCDAYAARNDHVPMGIPATGDLRELRKKTADAIRLLVDAKKVLLLRGHPRPDSHSAKLAASKKANRAAWEWITDATGVRRGDGIAWLDMEKTTKVHAFVQPHADRAYARKFPESDIAKKLSAAK